MAEALLEAAPGAVRALVLQGDTVLEAHLEREDQPLRPGHRAPAHLTKILVPGLRAVATLAGGAEVLLSPLPKAPEGSRIGLEITRSALPEADRPRLPRARPLGEIPPETPGPSLEARLRAAGHTVRPVTGPHDALEAAGWSETVNEATTGQIPFAGGLLTVTPTPAMITIDIDGDRAAELLAHSALVPLAKAIRRLDLQGSIAVDFPSLKGQARKALDEALSAALKAHLPGPHEATSINGFGLVQIVRPRTRPSLVEAVRTPGFHALELLRRAARHGHGPATLHAPPALIQWLAARPALIEAAERQRGGSLALRPDASLATSAAHVS
ncbi:MAG: ribonuclease [Polymorphobacter sp.]|uniref:ribonuclease n=1 Tax=Polymorphobacter sp. TaxID=1909290 RepID=UPI003A86F122